MTCIHVRINKRRYGLLLTLSYNLPSWSFRHADPCITLKVFSNVICRIACTRIVVFVSHSKVLFDRLNFNPQLIGLVTL